MGVVLAAVLSFAIQSPAQQPAQQSQAATQAAQPQPVPPEAIESLPVSLDKIKKELQEAPAPPSTLRIGELPTFRVTVEGRRKPMLPDFEETLKQAWQAPIPGGIHNKEILDMITPPEARPYGAFVNQDLLEVAITTFLQQLGMRAAGKGLGAVGDALRDWREEQIRREVEEELAAFKRANGIVDSVPPSSPPGNGSGQQVSPPDKDKKPPEKPPVKPPGV